MANGNGQDPNIQQAAWNRPEDRRPATSGTALENLGSVIMQGTNPYTKQPVIGADAAKASGQLRDEMRAKGIPGFKKGGKVPKTGIYKLHKGERVLNTKQVRRTERATKPKQNAMRQGFTRGDALKGF